MKDAHIRKIEQVKQHRDALPEHSELRTAYDKKLLKEEAGRNFVQDTESMSKIISQTKTAIEKFALRLAKSKTEWAVSDDFTLADVFWGVSFFRLTYLGYGWMWSDYPHVEAYAQRTYARPSVHAGAIAWPGHPPGDTIKNIV